MDFFVFLNLLAAVSAKQTVQQGRGCHSADTGGSSVREVRPRGQSGTSWLRCSKSENDRALWVCNVSAGPLPVHRHQARQGACWPGLEEARRDLRTSRPNSMRSQANLDEPYTSPKSPSARRPKSRQCSPPQRRGHRRLRRGRQTRLKRLCFQARQPRPVKAGWERTDE